MEYVEKQRKMDEVIKEQGRYISTLAISIVAIIVLSIILGMSISSAFIENILVYWLPSSNKILTILLPIVAFIELICIIVTIDSTRKISKLKKEINKIERQKTIKKDL